jgi:RNA polymerase sigma factor (sigma-70 family)
MSTVTVFNATNERWTEEFEEVFRAHARMIYRTAYSVTRNPQDAEDVVQNLFVELLRRGLPAKSEDLGPYLYRAAVNLSINAGRARARHVSIADEACERWTPVDAVAAERQEDAERRLAKAITQLHPHGSRVEIREMSELSLDHASDGLRIRLSKGSIIVNAAKQRNGHLYVQTKDMTVSVVGTVFVVNAEEAGSRVAYRKAIARR